MLGHADEGTTVRHYVKRTHVAPDLRVVIDQLVQRVEIDIPPGKTERRRRAGYDEGPHSRRTLRVGPFGWR